jgi:ABC-2 type transport system ATP-binding protein
VEDVPQNGQLLGPIYAVNDISLAIKQGETYGLLGPNGSGKTTLIWLILGLLTLTASRIRLFDEVMPNTRVLNQVGYMSQASALYEGTGHPRKYQLFAPIYGRFDTKWIEEILQWVDLTDWVWVWI